MDAGCASPLATPPAAAPHYQPAGHEVALFEAAWAQRLPLLLKGPTGCGKTRFVEYMAWKLGRPLVTVVCNDDTSAADLSGRWLLDANGTRWQDGPLALAARRGAICYLDELVEARADTTVVIHPLTDTRRKANLFATLGEGKPGGIVLSGHTDTVPWDGQGWTMGLDRVPARPLAGRGAGQPPDVARLDDGRTRRLSVASR